MSSSASLRHGMITLAVAGLLPVACADQQGPLPPVVTPPEGGSGLVYLDQGPNWTSATRDAFYAGPQGSEVMPLSWINALKQPTGMPFLADNLGRYGYLPNPAGPAGLPVGFTAAGDRGKEQFGMTCAACHTRQIDVAGRPYRIDGGPGIVDFQPFLTDLDQSVNHVLTDQAAFKEFAQAVLGTPVKPGDAAKLKQAVQAWFLRYDTLVKRALPSPAWGPSRLDAVGMIFDRLTGLDLGKPPSYLIADNIKKADAPVRYPFLWNAPIQDKTQWPGFADNGNDILGLARNLGEVYGVFATFHPKKSRWHILLGVDYTSDNSADFAGLGTLEDLIKKLGPPKWPWKLDATLAAQGKTVYDRAPEQGGCVSCHGVPPNVPAGVTRFFNQKTWATPIQDVGTDTREYQILAWNAESGVLSGAKIPFGTPVKPVDKSFNILGLSVIGSILQHYVPLGAKEQTAQATGAQATLTVTPEEQDLKGAFRLPNSAAASAPVNAYESRVLQGIWAAAPYLHNGSVPTLTELLKPPAERVTSFKLGPAYDIDQVGLAVQQTKFDYTLTTTGCENRSSGSSHCGHDFGTLLPPADKRALLEYLKSL